MREILAGAGFFFLLLPLLKPLLDSFHLLQLGAVGKWNVPAGLPPAAQLLPAVFVQLDVLPGPLGFGADKICQYAV